MGETTTTSCREHVWERHLEVHNRLERVVRVCVYCGSKEICWSKPPLQNTLKNSNARTAVASAATSSDGPQF